MAKIKKEVNPPTRRSDRVKDIHLKKLEAEQEAKAKITKPTRKRFHRPKQRKNCHLLNLPGELRNRIYRIALVEENIIVHSDGPGQPGLLRTCRAIRREASSIYYGENDFTLLVQKYDGASFLPFANQYRRYENMPGKVYFRLLGSPNWNNLVAWMKAHDEQNAMIPDMENPVLNDEYIMGGAIRIVEAMRFMPWKFKEEALQGFYHGMKGTCSRWVELDDRMPH